MTTEAGFLKAICAEPERDDIRLIFADYLDDQGQWARAAFVRCQIELAKLPPRIVLDVDDIKLDPQRPVKVWLGRTSDYDATRYGTAYKRRADAALYDSLHKDVDLRCRGHELHSVTIESYQQSLGEIDELIEIRFCGFGETDRHREKRAELKRLESELFVAAGPGQQEWFGPAHRLFMPGIDVATFLPCFSRGFLSRLTCTSEEWLQHADEIVGWTPIEQVELTTNVMRHIHFYGNKDEWWLDGHPRIPHIPMPGGYEVSILRRYWHRITFKLPPQGWPTPSAYNHNENQASFRIDQYDEDAYDELAGHGEDQL